MATQTIIEGDCLERLREMPDGSVQCVITSPPYWGLRSYLPDGSDLKSKELGSEPTPEAFVENLVEVFREVRRVMRNDATLWCNLGDSFNSQGTNMPNQAGLHPCACQAMQGKRIAPLAPGLKPKDLIGMPWRVAFALQADGFWLRSDIIWHKPNPMPESCTDRPTKAHEHVFLLTKRANYYYDADAVREPQDSRARSEINDGTQHIPGGYGKLGGGINEGARVARTEGRAKRVLHPNGRNKRDVWTIPTQGYAGSHYATFPEALCRVPILAGTSDKGACPQCGAPYMRIIDKKRVATRPAIDCKHDETGMANRDPERHVTETRTVGWEPGCGCRSDDVALLSGEPDDGTPLPYDPVPCTVLDPFSGAGTTGVVCKRTGRNYIGIELNPADVERSRRRIANPDAQRPAPDVEGQEMLFQEV